MTIENAFDLIYIRDIICIGRRYDFKTSIIALLISDYLNFKHADKNILNYMVEDWKNNCLIII